MLICFFVVGAAYNYQNIFVFISGLFVVIILFLITTGVEVNLKKMLYRDYIKIGPIKFGEWKTLGEFDYLLISKTQKRSQVPVVATVVSLDSSTINYDLDLITKGNRDVLLFTSGNREKTIALSKEIASDYNLRISEKVSGEFLWLTE